ncbi:MAG: hypothetical protein ABJA93_09890 [Sporichthyaceae bacterium]
MLGSELRQKRATLASRTAAAKRRPHDVLTHEAVERARVEYRVASLADHIKRTVEAAPALAAEQRDRLATLLRGQVTS